jgi:hypothetical protein
VGTGGTTGATGKGFTVSAKALEVPVQLPSTGVTVIVAVPTVFAVKEFMFPEPEAGMPIAVLLLVQLIVALAGCEVKVKGPASCPRHTDVSEGTVTTGVGLTKRGLLTTVEPHSLVAVS